MMQIQIQIQESEHDEPPLLLVDFHRGLLENIININMINININMINMNMVNMDFHRDHVLVKCSMRCDDNH